MDSHYEAQIRQASSTYSGGQARQFGSGAAGLGALAVRVGRSALPLLRKYALPLAKKVGRNLIEAAIPELGQALRGKKKIKSALKTSVKKSIAQTLQQRASAPRGARTLSRGVSRRGKAEGGPARAGGSARAGRPARAGGPARGMGRTGRNALSKQKISVNKKRKATASTCSKSPAKRSRISTRASKADILANLKFS